MVIFLKVKIKDIAQLANVSISTVSRVINNSKPVNDDVRKRVLEAIKQTNYRSNVIGLETDRANTQLIGVIIPQNSNTVLDDFNVGIRDLADLYGYDIMVGLTDGSAESEQHYLKMFQTMNIWRSSAAQIHLACLSGNNRRWI